MQSRKESEPREDGGDGPAPAVRPRVIVIAGPTASGKTSLAIQLSQKLDAPILSADSRQVYRELDIGVARPSAEELAAAPHHLLAYVSIHESYSAGRWARDARACLRTCFGESRRRRPDEQPTCIIAGGSGLHVQVLLEGLPEMPPVAPEIRTHFDARLADRGLDALLVELDRRDPDYGGVVDRANPARVLRALAAMEASGLTFTELRSRPATPLPYEAHWVVLSPPREELFRRIDSRVDGMIARGLEEEVRNLANWRSLDALQTIGYREWWRYFDGESDRATTIASIKSASRGYARRQTTWNRRLEALQLSQPEADLVLRRLR